MAFDPKKLIFTFTKDYNLIHGVVENFTDRRIEIIRTHFGHDRPILGPELPILMTETKNLAIGSQHAVLEYIMPNTTTIFGFEIKPEGLPVYIDEARLVFGYYTQLLTTPLADVQKELAKKDKKENPWIKRFLALFKTPAPAAPTHTGGVVQGVVRYPSA